MLFDFTVRPPLLYFLELPYREFIRLVGVTPAPTRPRRAQVIFKRLLFLGVVCCPVLFTQGLKILVSAVQFCEGPPWKSKGLAWKG
jgi:hypothetical protein